MIRDLVVRDAGSKGKGVFALRQFEPGEFIFRRRHGRVVRNTEIPMLSEEERRHLCELDGESSAVLLPPGCFLNHSCDPNAMRRGSMVFAWTAIPESHEITIDYRLNAFGEDTWRCDCGSSNCTGYVVGSFFSLSRRQQHAYLPYAPTFIRNEYRRRLAAHRV